MIALALLACVRSTPVVVAPAALEFEAVQTERPSGLDGWHLVQGADGQLWTELWGTDAEELAEGAVPPASQVRSEQIEAADPELARRFAALVGTARPVAFTWPESGVPTELERAAIQLVAVVPVLTSAGQTGVRAWFRRLDEGPEDLLAITRFTEDASPPLGLRQASGSCEAIGETPVPLDGIVRHACEDCPSRCVSLPLHDGRLAATEYVMDPEAGAAQTRCIATSVRFEHGGARYFKPECVETEHTSLPEAWFGNPTVQWLVLGRSTGTSATRCLARLPAADEPVRAMACVYNPAP